MSDSVSTERVMRYPPAPAEVRAACARQGVPVPRDVVAVPVVNPLGASKRR